MIIRAVSDNESDSDDLGTPPTSPKPHRSVFDPPVPVSLSATRNSAQYLWLSVSLLVVLLLLVDLAALFGSFQPTVDAFGLIAIVPTFVTSGPVALLPPTATLCNQFVGFALVGVWIYSRETSLAPAGAATRSRYGIWVLAALLALGHVVSCLYLLFALFESNGDRSKFWLGRKHPRRASTAPYGRV
ncbi:hypothetical protein PHYBOEH_004812 [Phytophthora boehmeriae]|uniref:Transmembrane protein n=1 Tax=Phytophthora boehmeriae TaxID=109152 RepID=A0A8T1WQR4_9STRA|nr:hypothetical protein PHYBOEH_004812 [Phytophthora boehmeriae]